MSLEDRERIEGSFMDILSKIKEVENVVTSFEISTANVPLNQREQQYTFSAFKTLLKDIYNTVDKLDDKFREFKN